MQTMPRTESEVSAVSSMDVAGNLSVLAQRPSVELALEAMREFLGMDVAYASEIIGDQMALHAMDGDGESFCIAAG